MILRLQVAKRVPWPDSKLVQISERHPWPISYSSSLDHNHSAHLDIDWTIQGEPSNAEDAHETVQYNGRQYRTLDGVSSTSRLEGCQRSLISLPSGGWEVANRDADSLAVIAAYPWGTSCMHLAAGESIRTASHPRPGTECNLLPPTTNNTDKLTRTSSLIKIGPSYFPSYRPTGCNRRVLISRPTPFQVLANTSLSYHGNKCSAMNCSCSFLGVASTLPPNGVDCGCSCRVVTSRSVRSWSLHRRNFDHISTFSFSGPVLLTGFDHPPTHPQVISALISNIEEPPFTLLSLKGVSQLQWHVEPLRYQSEKASTVWVSDGTDGGVLAGAPLIISECKPLCSLLSNVSGTASVVVSQGPQRRNGVVEWNVTLLGQSMNFSQVLITQALLVLDFDVIRIFEDQQRNPTLNHHPHLLSDQTAFCAVKVKFAGDLTAPDSLSGLKFTFENISYHGNTSMFVIQDHPGEVGPAYDVSMRETCAFNTPRMGMALQGKGACRDLTFKTFPDSCGNVSVSFTVSLGNLSQHYNMLIMNVASNDRPAFRFNCSNLQARILSDVQAVEPENSQIIARDDYKLSSNTCISECSTCMDSVNWINCSDASICTTTYCDVPGTEACCLCGGGKPNRPPESSLLCSLSLTVSQLSPAERWHSQTNCSGACSDICASECISSAISQQSYIQCRQQCAGTGEASLLHINHPPYPYNSFATGRQCLATVLVEQAVIDISSATWHSADEHLQKVTFSVVPVFANYTKFFSQFALPSIDAMTGNLFICLERGRRPGNVSFDVFLWDDGGTDNEGVNVYGPTRLNLEILPVNQEPSFLMCCGTILHVIESSGRHWIPEFAIEITKGERDENGFDLEALQSVTFVVMVSSQNINNAFVSSPRLHVSLNLYAEEGLFS
jgi:hypothetical protein